MANGKQSESRAADIIKNWIRTRYTIEFLGTWEMSHNPNFNVVEFDHFRMQAGLPSFVMSVSKWVEKTNAIEKSMKRLDYACKQACAGIQVKRWSMVFLLSLYGFVCMEAQELKLQGTSAEELVPTGWQHQEATGDLNHDGYADLAIVATSNDKAHLRTRDDGYVYNFNQPILAIYFGTPQGTFRLWRQYAEVIPPSVIDEMIFVDVTLSVTDRGVLSLATETFMSMGGYATYQTHYSYRYQQGDFYLIGRDQTSGMRNTGEMETVSENYLTWKRQVVKDNMFEETPRRTERWSRLPRKPLEKLGERTL